MLKISVNDSQFSGSQALAEIEHTLGELRQNLSTREAELLSIKKQADENLRNQTELLRELANYRLDAIEAENVLSALNHSDAQAKQYLAQRDEAQLKLTTEIAQQDTLIKNAEHRRLELAAAHTEKVKAVVALEAKIQEQLDSDAEYQALFEKAEQGDSMADRAEDKATQAQQDRRNKGHAYEKDKIFSYLWDRGFGTSEYKGRGLFKALDSWCARLCKFDQARVDYWTLLEIPKRLASHASLLRQESDDAIASLERYEKAAADKLGLPNLQSQTVDTQAELDNQDALIETLESKRNTLQLGMSQYLTGQDEFSLRATQVLVNFMDGKDGSFLKSMAKETYDQKDDLLGADLDDLRDEFNALQPLLAEQKELQRKATERLNELEKVRQKFKSHHYDDLRSSFKNSNLVVSILGQFILGLVSSIDVWRVLAELQQHRQQSGMPDFGSGGLGRNSQRKRSSTWQWPSGSGGKFRVPSNRRSRSPRRPGPRRSKGGFRTGGGF